MSEFENGWLYEARINRVNELGCLCFLMTQLTASQFWGSANQRLCEIKLFMTRDGFILHRLNMYAGIHLVIWSPVKANVGQYVRLNEAYLTIDPALALAGEAALLKRLWFVQEALLILVATWVHDLYKRLCNPFHIPPWASLPSVFVFSVFVTED